MFKKIDQKQRIFTLIFELVTHSTYEMKVVVMIHRGLVTQWPRQALHCLSALVRALMCTST
jgi:hypothetical protein